MCIRDRVRPLYLNSQRMCAFSVCGEQCFVWHAWQICSVNLTAGEWHARAYVPISTAIEDETKDGKAMLAKASVNVLRSEPVY